MNDNTKVKNSAIAGFLGVLTLVVIYSVIWGPARKYTDSLYPSRTINVSSEGKVTVEPDVAVFTFSVVIEGTDPEKIASDNNATVNRALDFVKSKGVDQKDLKTISYSLNPKYTYDEKSRKSFIYGYTLTQTVQVKVRKIGDVAQILGGLPGLGINQIGSVSFEVDDPERFLKEARDKAFEKAREKANQMVSKMGVRLGKVVNFSEYGGPGPIPIYREGIGMGGDFKTAAVPTIQPGSQEITVNVNITYEIR